MKSVIIILSVCFGFLFVISVILAVWLVRNTENNYQPYKNIWNDKKLFGAGIDLLRNTNKTFQSLNKQYFLFYGSLLGAIRHKGFIPWDDDVDIVVSKNTFDNLFTYEEEFSKHGLMVKKFNKYFHKISPKEYLYDNGKSYWPFVDVFWYELKDDMVIISNGEHKDEYLYFKTSDIFPLQNTKFHTLNLPIPNNYTNVLNSLYNDWEEKCISSPYNHRKEMHYRQIYETDCSNALLDVNTDIFNNVYVINLKRRPDRWNTTKKRLHNIGISPHRWDAVDAKDDEFLKFYESKNLKNRAKGEVACYKSHLELWKYLLSIEVPYAIIFEDDIVFPDDVSQDLIMNEIEESKGFDILFLGHCYSNQFKFSNEITRINSAMCLHAYVVTRSALQKLVKNEHNYTIPIDHVTYKLCKSKNMICFSSFTSSNKNTCMYGEGIIFQDDYLGSNIQRKTIFNGLMKMFKKKECNTRYS